MAKLYALVAAERAPLSLALSTGRDRDAPWGRTLLFHSPSSRRPSGSAKRDDRQPDTVAERRALMVTAKELPQVVNGRTRLPDIPERNPDEKMTAFDHVHRAGNAYLIAQYLLDQGAEAERLLVTADHWIVQDAEDFQRRRRYPDLMVAFDVDLEAHKASNGYIIAEQGKSPDFVLKVASQSTGRVDVGPKRDDYEAFGIREYWRFDEAGAFHGVRLAGDRLAEGRYEPIEIAAHDDGSLRGCSAALDVVLQWQEGRLGWLDPRTSRHIPTFLDERLRAENAEANLRRLEEELRGLREE